MNDSRAPTNPAFDSLEQEVFLSLWRVYDRLRLVEEEFFARYDLTPQQYNLLRLVRQAHPERVPTLALAGRLVSRAPDITRMLDKLEERGLIDRVRPVENRRQVLVGLTPPGQTLLQEMAVPLQECHRRQLGHLSEARLRQLGGLLRAVLTAHEEPGSFWARARSPSSHP